MAVADAMKTEYEKLHQAGFLVQVDCPDLAMARCEKDFANVSTQGILRGRGIARRRRSIAPSPASPPKRCDCICAGATMKGRITATWNSRT